MNELYEKEIKKIEEEPFFLDTKSKVSEYQEVNKNKPMIDILCKNLLNAFKCLMLGGHSGFSIRLTMIRLKNMLSEIETPITIQSIEKLNELEDDIKKCKYDENSDCEMVAMIDGDAIRALRELCYIGYTKKNLYHAFNLLDMLVKGYHLLPLEDNDDCWVFSYNRPEYTCYHHKKCTGVFKDVYNDGRPPRYNDVNRVNGQDIDSKSWYHSGFLDDIVNEHFPIKFPYLAGEVTYLVTTETLLIDRKNGDFDTRAIFEIIPSDNSEPVKIYRYFTERDGETVEIDVETYNELKKKAINRFE